MARIYKATAYIVDFNGEFEGLDTNRVFWRAFEDGHHDSFITTFDEDKSEKFDWNDNLKINTFEATQKDYEEYFK